MVHMNESSKQTAVITVVGRDRVGIIARVAGLLAASTVNIKDISQTILQGIFTMIMLVEIGEMTIDIKDLADRLDILGQELGLSIRVQHSDIFDAMHRI
jgi:ACT domain-containing protein